MGGEVKRPKVLLCYDYQNGIKYEEEDIIFAIEPKKISTRTISLFERIQYVKTIDVEVMDTSGKTNTSKFNYGVQGQKKKNWQ